MNTWIKSLLIGLAIAGIAFFVSQKFTNQNKKQLSTVHCILEIAPDKSLPGQENDLLTALNNIPVIIKRRCEAAGYISVVKVNEKEKNLDITIQDVDDVSYASYIITRNNKLEFRELYTLNEIPAFLKIGKKTTNEDLPQNTKSPGDSDKTINIEEIIPKQGTGQTLLDTIFSYNKIYSTGTGNTSYSADIGSINEKDTAALNQLLQSKESLDVLPTDIKFYYGLAADLSKRKNSKVFYLYAIRTNGDEIPLLQNRDIESAKQDYDMSGRPEVTFRFTTAGARKWEQMTRKNIDHYLAIILDNSVISAPRVNEAITGGSSSISGGFSVKEAQLLAAHLNGGIIPANLNIIKQEIIPEKAGNNRKLILIILSTFIVSTGLALLVFNALKNK